MDATKKHARLREAFSAYAPGVDVLLSATEAGRFQELLATLDIEHVDAVDLWLPHRLHDALAQIHTVPAHPLPEHLTSPDFRCQTLPPAARLSPRLYVWEGRITCSQATSASASPRTWPVRICISSTRAART